MSDELIIDTGKGSFPFSQLGALLPGMAEIMPLVGDRVWRCYYAGAAHNQPLARFQLKEAVNLLKKGCVLRPKYTEDVDAFCDGIIAALMKTIDDADWVEFERTFHNMIRAANGYHAKFDKPWLRYKLPSEPPPDLDVTPLEGEGACAMGTSWLTGPEWLAVLRIGIGLWWLESWRHKDKKGWFQRGTGISWAKSVAEKHRWGFVRTGFDKIVAPRPKAMAYVVVFSELAIGLGLVFGFLTPIAAIGGALLNLVYFVLMIHDWAEQGQNWSMFVAQVVIVGAHGWSVWSLDEALGLFGT